MPSTPQVQIPQVEIPQVQVPQVQVWIGAPSPGGLALPDAHPSSSTLYGPRGVFIDDRYLIVADTGNHRVLIWHGVPKHDHSRADIVLGQHDFTTEGPNARGHGPGKGLNMPTAVSIVDGNLVVADSWNHRIVVWDGVPQSSYQAPVLVIGQPDLTSVECNPGRDRDGSSFNWPFGFLVQGKRWLEAPFDGRPAEFVLGQPDMRTGEENRGATVSSASFRWPHAAAIFDNSLWVADAGNHRVLAWPQDLSHDQPAVRILGQKDFTSNQEFVMARQSAQSLRFPYGIAAGKDWLAVTDTANNRVLGWSAESLRNAATAPTAGWVLGQPDFHSNGENHWKAVAHNTLCWPYGLASHNNLLAVADSGNNRVIIWQVPSLAETLAIQEEEVPLCV